MRDIEQAMQRAYAALEAFAIDKWGDVNPIVVPDDEKPLCDVYYEACPYAPSVMIRRLTERSNA